jgi:CubicO group peptidase (beta-lactamase class C family)
MNLSLLMKTRLLIGGLLFAGALSCNSPTEVVDILDPVELCTGDCWPGASWTTAPSPAALGWSESGLEKARKYSREIDSDAVMIIDRGLVVAEWGSTKRVHYVQSARKSFLSVLYGIYIAEGAIDLSLTLADLGLDDNPPSLTDTEKQATLEQLIQARSGVYHEAAAESQSMKDARPPRGSHLPGTFWYYNNWDFNVLGVVFNQLTGGDLFQALYDRLAVPLDMQDFKVSDGFYMHEPVSEHPAYPFAMSARDMGRLGLLMAREGRWRDEQIVPESWVVLSTQAHSDTGGVWDYGYMWWVGQPTLLGGRRMFAALGGAGHAIFVFPDEDLVIVHRVDAATFRFGWDQVDELLQRILAAGG